MILKHYVVKNWWNIRDKYSILEGHSAAAINPRHVKRIYPRLWQKYGQIRLYIPLSPTTNAGFIDLDREIVKTIPDRFATPAQQMQKLLIVLNQLKSDCYVDETVKNMK